MIRPAVPVARPALDDRPWRPLDRVWTGAVLALFWGLVAFLLVTLLTACNDGPHAGDRCANPGDYYGHGSTRVHCTDRHVWSK